MTFEELYRIAEVYFLIKQKRKRARSRFLKVTDWKVTDEGYIFYALFQGGNRQIHLHTVTIRFDGLIVE
ncbi:hypothetical protein DFP93_101292 [Aneurinibacillus soli]|uniref:Uncharacterized protein n=1 Tax=Aneurinibacillus soli TaxID=1500254 RepID=A0A0U5BDD6_9BACL|nr:hypothetical protein DFP93_101292 [Aneurinibacillus soli]BAU28215.1 hypothetical protein CB4_02389 [Aneurinibacillus soli]